MARAMDTDPFQGLRFHVKATKAGGANLESFTNSAGFNTVSLPTHTVETVEYKEGIMVYRRKFPGDTTFDDITLTRGVTVANSEFWQWIDAASSGREYRADLKIYQFHRDDITDESDFSTIENPSRIINCFDCFPISVKSGSDMDSLSSEISIQEIVVSLERFSIENKRA